MNEKMTDQLVKAIGIRKNDRVLVHYWGEDNYLESVSNFMKSIVKQQAIPFLYQQSRIFNALMFQHRDSELPEAYYHFFESFNVVLDIFAYQPVVLGSEVEESSYIIYRKHMANLFQHLMHATTFAQIRMPTIENAEESHLDPDDYILRLTEAYDIDYDLLKEKAKELQEKLSSSPRWTLRTAHGCTLSFDVKDRAWLADTGNGDLPCGEVYIAPNEHETEGSVYFEKLCIDQQTYVGLTLTVEKGYVINSNQLEFNIWLDHLSEKDRLIGEIGFGLNPHVKDLCGLPLLDEKKDGSFHIGLGMNTMFGGNHEADNHIDLVNGEGLWELEK